MQFRAYATQPDDELDLCEGALLIARDAHPGLDSRAVSDELERLAAPLVSGGVAYRSATAQARALSDHLFTSLGFRGNREDYYDPRNSFLNEVLERRTGIPISLSVVYVEVARRAGIAARPVGFPGHFLVRVDDHSRRVVIDPFHGGRALDEVGLAELLRRSGSRLRYSADMITPTPVRHVLARMLMNLRGVYAARGEYAKLLVVLDRLIDLLPQVTDELRDRGMLLGRLGAPGAAVRDLDEYLERTPNASDAAEVRRYIDRFELDSERLRGN